MNVSTSSGPVGRPSIRRFARLGLVVAAIACAGLPARALAQCSIEGLENVTEGQKFTLCAPAGYTYRWAGPGLPNGATSRCVTIAGRSSGLYEYTVTLLSRGVTRDRCMLVVTVGNSPVPNPYPGGGGTGECAISGPDTFEPGTRVRLCGPSGATSYRWTGPNGFSSTGSCITVNQEGTYSLRVRDRYGDVRDCTTYLDAGGGSDDADQPYAENCPRNHTFWAAACRGTRGDVSAAEMRSLARCVDERAQSFQWTDDAGGLCQALRPAGTLTQRKQATRQLATLLANICAAELGISAQGGATIGLDADTPISYRNARTVGELAALVDRMLARGRGNFADVNRILQAVNNGRGIGPVCNE